MHVWHQRSPDRKTVHEFLAEILGMRTRKADPADSRYCPHRIGQLGKAKSILRIPIGIHVLAE